MNAIQLCTLPDIIREEHERLQKGLDNSIELVAQAEEARSHAMEENENYMQSEEYRRRLEEIKRIRDRSERMGELSNLIEDKENKTRFLQNMSKYNESVHLYLDASLKMRVFFELYSHMPGINQMKIGYAIKQLGIIMGSLAFSLTGKRRAEYLSSDERKRMGDILKVDKSADLDEIKRAYRKLALRYHPDKNLDPEAEKIFRQVNEAYEKLGKIMEK